MENNDITYLLREEKRLEALIKQYQNKQSSQGLSEKEKIYYEEFIRNLADIRRRKNNAY